MSENLTPAVVWTALELGLVELDLPTGRAIGVKVRQVCEKRERPTGNETMHGLWCVALPEQIRGFAAMLVQKADEAARYKASPPPLQ